MMNGVHDRSREAQRLRDDEALNQFIAEIRADAFALFENSGTADAATRNEAHATLQALMKLTGKFESAIADQKIADKKK